MNLHSIDTQTRADDSRREQTQSTQPAAARPAEVTVNRPRGPSIVWLIPIIAVLIGSALAYKTITEKGPLVTISFKTADGLEAGKTKIKYKAVEVGLVESVAISDDLETVVAMARLDKEAERHLTAGTRFWVVRPHLGLTGISGLGTLVSGAYITVDPGEGAPQYAFTGVETPPVVRADLPGNKYVLTTSELGSVAPGSPVYYRDIRVGEVLNYELRDDEKTIDVHVFVESPHHRLVREGTRFFNVSGIDVSMTADGMQVRTASLVSLIAGGIAFQTLEIPSFS